jgi:hypothetical protein
MAGEDVKAQQLVSGATTPQKDFLERLYAG